MSEVKSVLIADDHDIVRDAVAHVVGNELGVPVATAHDKSSALELMDSHGPYSVVLLDIAMPGMTNPGAVLDVVRANAPGAVVVFSGLVDETFVRQAILNGARGYIPKTLPLKSLSRALELVASGQVFVPFMSSDQVFTKPAAPKLGIKEVGVLRLLVKGLTNKEIARELDLTEVRIKMHLRNICARLGAKNRTQAAMIAEHQGLLGEAFADAV